MEGLQINATLIVQAVIFIIAIGIVTEWIFKPIVQVIKERQARVKGFHSEAQSFTAEADRMKREYETRLKEARQKARNIREELRLTGFAAREKMLTQARNETKDYLEKIRAGIAAQIDQVRPAMDSETHRLSRDVARNILGKDVV